MNSKRVLYLVRLGDHRISLFQKNRLQIRVPHLVYIFLLANCMSYIHSNDQNVLCSYKMLLCAFFMSFTGF